MPLLPIFGHDVLRARLREAVDRGTLPASLLLQGPRGVGKQQIALWLARLLLCEKPDQAPCGACKSCRMTSEARHPDLHWYFPRPRLKDGNPDISEVREDMAEAIAERLSNGGVYEASGGEEGIHIATVRAIVQSAAISPAIASRKVFVIGDADRMVAQEGAEVAANAFLKLLEEPPADTTIILTSSEPGALLPTIRSRIVSVRVAPMAPSDVRAFLENDTVAGRLDFGDKKIDDLIALAGGAPGRLVGREASQSALAMAERLLEAAASLDRAPRLRISLGQGMRGARGKFSDTLDALTALLHQRARLAAIRGNEAEALGAARAMDAVERAKELSNGNVNPQLVTASLLRTLAPLVR